MMSSDEVDGDVQAETRPTPSTTTLTQSLPAGLERRMQLRTLVCTESYREARGLDPAEVQLIVPDERDLLWLDLDSPSLDELQTIATAFSFHPLAVEDAAQEHQRSKIDHYDSFYFLVLFGVSYNERTRDVLEQELDVFLGRNYLVTVHYSPIGGIEALAKRLHTDLGTLDHGVGALLYSLADTIVDSYLPVAEQIKDSIQELERRVFASQHPRARRGLHEDIFSLRAELLELRTVISPEREVLAVLSRRGLRVIDKKTGLYFRDVSDHLQRVIETIDVYHQMLAGVLDSYNAQSANALNEVMRVLTSYSIILMSITFIAGVYGMNFNTTISPFNMPELNLYFGYPLALGGMIVLATSLGLYFKRRGWL
jgi:magnesium transporter